MRLFEESASFTYSVAWIDCFARKKHLGRSILGLGEHSTIADLPSKLRGDPLRHSPIEGVNIPFFFPKFAINYASVKAFNFVYYHKQLSERHEDFMHYDDYFYPLDGIHHWNRIYGRNGFLQYQFVLPKENSYDGLKTILEKIGRSGQGSPLAVLKLFGKQNPHSVMSFPMEGYTLALDFKVNVEVFRLLDELDEVVLTNGGRLYLAKDARMSPRVFHGTYSKIVPSNTFNSAQTSRLEF